MSVELANLKSELKRFAFVIQEALYPRICFGCHQEGCWLCSSCRQQLPLRSGAFCPVCRRENYWGESCKDCASAGLKALAVAYDYDQRCLAAAIKACKYNYAYTVGQELGELLAEFWLARLQAAAELAVQPAWLDASFLVVPVPLYRRKQLSRGFNQSEYLARAVAAAAGYDCDCRSLSRQRQTASQVGLSAEHRRANLSQAFVWSGASLSGRSVLLVDDVFTTGATMLSAASALRQAGAKRIVGLALASGAI